MLITPSFQVQTHSQAGPPLNFPSQTWVKTPISSRYSLAIPQFAGIKKTPVTRAQVEQLGALSQAFDGDSNKFYTAVIASPALTTMEAEVLLSFVVAAQQRGFSGRYTPRYLADIAEKYSNAAAPVEKQVVENWPARWQAIQTETKALLPKTTLGTCPVAVLLKLGYRNAEVSRGLQMSSADVTGINSKAGLEKDAIRQQNDRNEVLIAQLPVLTGADLPKNWQLERSSLKPDKAIDAFLALNSVTQRAIIIYCELKGELKGKPVTEVALCKRFLERYGIPIRRATLSRHVTTAQTALGYIESDEARYGVNRAKGIQTTKSSKAFVDGHKTLPANWKKNPTADETKIAAEKFVSLSPLVRLVFTLKCEHPEWSDKELAAHISANYFKLRGNNVGDALAVARSILDLRDKSAVKRKETQLKAAEVKALIESDLPDKWPSGYGFEDIEAARAIWQDPKKLSDFYRIILQTQSALAQSIGKLPTRTALARAVSKILKKKIKPALIQKPLYEVRRRLNFTGFEKPDPNGIMAFNTQHGSFSRVCPHDIWVLTSNGNDNNPKGIEDRFKKLQPLERLAIQSLIEVTGKAGEVIDPDRVLSEMRQRCSGVPTGLTKQIVSHTLSAARKKLKLPPVRVLRVQIETKRGKAKRLQ